MSFASKIQTMFRGDLPVAELPREGLRRRRAAEHRRRERLEVDQIAGAGVRLSALFDGVGAEGLLHHFREREARLFSSFCVPDEALGRTLPREIESVVARAYSMVDERSWHLAGFGPVDLDKPNVWRTDPLGSRDWGLEYHADVVPYPSGGADIRVLWELNRMGHTLTLGTAYAVTGDERFAETFFSHVESWIEQNPYGRGANWHCAMEAAIRAINLLAAFEIFRSSEALTAERLNALLRFFDQHGRFIFANNEFSFIATSNHYLTDVVGLFWIGTMLPELAEARKWREFGLGEMLAEMEKQVLPDGGDFEASTGYHRFATEMFLYSLLLAERSGVELPPKFRDTVRKMAGLLDAVTFPNGRMPLIGDADGSRIVPLADRDADEAGYLLSFASVLLDEPRWARGPTIESAFLLGERGPNGPTGQPSSEAFPDSGLWVMRSKDLYLCIRAGEIGLNGRGSHAHNDALSLVLWAFGDDFLIDPGSYVYNLDRDERHRFRSTAYHSTIMVDDAEQNTISADMPFVMGNEAKPRLIKWQSDQKRDVLTVEHSGYRRLPQPLVHRRTVVFDKERTRWSVQDELRGDGRHLVDVHFHCAPGISFEVRNGGVNLRAESGASIKIVTDLATTPEIRPAFASNHYGRRTPSNIISWRFDCEMPLVINFELIPAAGN